MQDSDVKERKPREIKRAAGESCDFCFLNRTHKHPDPLKIACVCEAGVRKCLDPWCRYTDRPQHERPYVKRST